MTLDADEIAAQKKKVPFTNYLRPNGTREQTEMPVSLELADKVDIILAKGLKFESEYLSTGDWSFTIADPKEEVDVACELLFRSKMEPDARTAAIAAIEKMIREFKI
jgi:hypothetical protein